MKRGCGIQGVWNIREKELTRPALMVPFTCFADGIRTYLNKKFLSDVQIPCTCIQNSLLYTLNREKIRLNNANKYFFGNVKNWVYLLW